MPHRWFQKRVQRYSYIICDTHEAAMLSPQTHRARRGFDKWLQSCTMPPLLPSLLAGCTPLAKLSLHVQRSQGKHSCPLTWPAPTSLYVAFIAKDERFPST